MYENLSTDRPSRCQNLKELGTIFRLDLISKRVAKSIHINLMSMHRHTSPASFPNTPFLLIHSALHPPQIDLDHEALAQSGLNMGKGCDSITFADQINTCSRTMANFHSPTDMDREKQEKEVNFESIHFRNHVQNGKSSIIKSVKQLLPVELTTLLSPPYEDLLKTAFLIDQSLLKQKKYECMDTLENISSMIYSKLGSKVDKVLLGQINCLSPLYYQIYQDPLKNLVIGLPKQSNLLVKRKKILRTALHRFAVTYCEKGQQLASVQEKLPYVLLQPRKTARFFPKNKHFPYVKQATLLKEEFLANTKQAVLQRQAELSANSQVRIVRWGKTQLLAFVQELIDIYRSLSVKNLFKANLIDLQATKRSTEEVQAALTILLSTNSLLHQSSQSGPCILSLHLQQKQKCLLLLSDLSQASL